MSTNGNGNGKPKKQLSPETREKLSKLAKERHARGEFGGAKFGRLGGRPRKDRATKAVAEAAQDEKNKQAIINVFKDAVDPSQPISVRIKGAQAWLEAEGSEGKLQIQESEADNKQRSRSELIDILTKRLTSGPAAQLLAERIASQGLNSGEPEPVDAEVVVD